MESTVNHVLILVEHFTVFLPFPVSKDNWYETKHNNINHDIGYKPTKSIITIKENSEYR